jgi:hypothetical protein
MKRFVALLAACGSDPGLPDPPEVVTTVTLTFTRTGGGAPIVFVADDPDGEGPELPVADPVRLARGQYTLDITFENRLETPAVNITDEVVREATHHQVFLVGSAVGGPASQNPSAALGHTYADMDANGDPIGLSNTIAANGGAGSMIVILRHLPPIDGMPAKTPDIADQARAGGVSAIAGENDVNLTFNVAVQAL